MKKKNLIKTLFLIGMLLGGTISPVVASSSPDNWWPVQKRPGYILKCTLSRPGDIREMNVAQSLCGLAAQAVNEGIGNEGLWVENRTPDYQLYYKAWLKRLKVKERGALNTWEVVKRFQKQGYIKGYILYDYNRKDNSISLATAQAGILKGILVDITLEEQAKASGLQKLYDASKENLTRSWFDEHKSRMNNNFIVLTNPSIANNRDYAIAHKGMVYYGVDELLDTILEWVRPLSPVIGWNSGPEFQHIAPCSYWGLINTASDWCMNLPMISITGNEKIKKIKQQILAFCLRQGYQYDGSGNWTAKHVKWLRSLKTEGLYKEILDEYLLTYTILTDKLNRLDQRIEELASEEEYKEPVSKLTCFLGIKTHTALSVIVEVGDFQRFASARKFAGYLGLVPGQHSSGDDRNGLGITKAGNTHVRRLLVESAQSYTRGKIGYKSRVLRSRQAGNSPQIINYADRANERLRRRYYQMVLKDGKKYNIAKIAVARELACFIWGMMTDNIY